LSCVAITTFVDLSAWLIIVFYFQGATPNNIEWVAEARWVVDGNVWTSSGVAAGVLVERGREFFADG
jgi:putative intracellular protease/amidase